MMSGWFALSWPWIGEMSEIAEVSGISMDLAASEDPASLGVSKLTALLTSSVAGPVRPVLKSKRD